MSEWQAVKVGSFLTEREGRYKPADTQLQNIPRLDKIDFSGTIHLSTKPTKTDMIIVQPGDLVISGINVAKGAIAIWDGGYPITATIHFSSYIFDKAKIDIDFFKRYLKSPAFIKALKNQVKGGIKTEIKANHLLPLQVNIPPLPTQHKVKKYFESFEGDLSDLTGEIANQSAILAKLRQAILQEAIEGKLTADWRDAHPVRKGDADYDAGALLEKIKAEKINRDGAKGKRKGASLALRSINADDMPFAVPEGWVWTRLEEISNSCLGKMLDTYKNHGQNFPYLRNLNVRWFSFDLSDLKNIRLEKNEIEKYSAHKGDLLVCEGGYPGRAAIWDSDDPIIFQKAIHRIRFIEPRHNKWLLYYLKLLDMNRNIEHYFTGAGIQHLTGDSIKKIILPLPPLAEQRAIVERVEKMLVMVGGLETQVKERQGQTAGLLQAVLREAFEGGGENHGRYFF